MVGVVNFLIFASLVLRYDGFGFLYSNTARASIKLREQMAFFGFFVKHLIELKHSIVSHHPKDPAGAQMEQLRTLLSKAQDTAIGKAFDFAKLLQDGGLMYAAFKDSVPIYDYDRIREDWWERQMEEPNITWPGQPEYYALSSGTTGKESKRLPVTRAMIDHFNAVSRAQAESLANFHLPASFFDRDVLGLSSSANLKRVDGHLEGEISGINVSNLPDAFQNFYKPGLEIARIDDWEKRLQAIVKAAPNWDVGAIAGIPSWVKEMLRAIIEHYSLQHIHELWPHLALYTSGGVAFEPHRESFNNLLSHPITVMETYLASEGFFAFNARPDTTDMQLAVDHGVFYEFIPFDERGFDGSGQLLDHPTVVPLMAVEPNQEYALLVSTPAGAWRYLIGDTIRFTDISRCELVITGRTKYFLNVVGSQLSEEKLNTAVLTLSEEVGRPFQEFTVGALPSDSDRYYHQWILAVEGPKEAEVNLSNLLDQHLQTANEAYHRARTQALEAPKVRVVSLERLYEWLNQHKKKGGQIKIPKVMQEEDLRDLMQFLREE